MVLATVKVHNFGSGRLNDELDHGYITSYSCWSKIEMDNFDEELKIYKLRSYCFGFPIKILLDVDTV